MRRPIQSGKAFAYFGLMIGSLPPLTLAIRFIAETMPVEGFSRLFVALLAVTGLVAGALGYVTGHLIPPVIRGLETYRFPNRIVLWSIVGFLWGAVSGGAGGVFLFLIGSIFAAIAGGLVGAVTLPIMTMFYSLLRCGDAIERDHFLPIALGITFSLCALLLGL